MPKRSAAEKIEYYSAKIQKLKRKSDRIPRRRVIVYSSDSDEKIENGSQAEVHDDASRDSLSPEQSPLPSPPPSPSPPSAPPPHAPTGEVISSQKEPDEIIELDLDPELLQALGDASEDAPVYGPDINKNLAQRWLPILKKGLQSDVKENLLKDYTIPDNCRLLRAPVLNPEIAAAVTDLVRGRDKKLQIKQDQLGLGVTAINKAMSLLLTGDDKVQAIKILSDGCRLLVDLHRTETELRKKLITPALDKSFLTVIQDQERDECLFGNNLSDKIKASKTIERHGLQIKKSSNTKPSSSSIASTSGTRYQGNWSGPPRFQTARRGGRTTSYRGQPRLAPPTSPPATARRRASAAASSKRTRRDTRK